MCTDEKTEGIRVLTHIDGTFSVISAICFGFWHHLDMNWIHSIAGIISNDQGGMIMSDEQQMITGKFNFNTAWNPWAAMKWNLKVRSFAKNIFNTYVVTNSLFTVGIPIMIRWYLHLEVTPQCYTTDLWVPRHNALSNTLSIGSLAM